MTTHYGNKWLKDRSEIAEKGTIFDDELGKEYHSVWEKNVKNSKSQKSLFGINSLNFSDIHFELVSDVKQGVKWKFIADNFHYVPHSPSSIKPYGRFLRYFIKEQRNIIGIIAVSGSFLSLEARDTFIGWNKEQRLKNNKKIAQNLIYCILPSINVPNLSSVVLSKFSKVVKNDWELRYGDKLVLLDTLVDPALYKGTSYIASGWIYVGMTKGFGCKSIRKDVKGFGAENMGRILFKHNIPKMIFIKPLHRYWRKELLKSE